MARSTTVWGIDVGQCALKALRCRLGDEDDKLVAEAFDYIEYPKILSQPGSDPAELVGDALKQFLSRNSVKGDRVAISVSGQAGLARFIKLPPVEAKKIPDIVRYEARQQIPFDLNDVIWDYQRMGGGSEEDGFALETEVGLFAMKREAVFRTIEPFQQAGIDVDIVQLTPLTLYNFVLFDQLRDLPAPEDYDPEDPPESVIVISLGTDATDLVVTNGYRVWQRSIPLGGNHFTRALTKELKLTFAKAEHLKRNAAAAQDPKAVFQAMRPVFNDLLTELHRSISYFTTVDRAAKIQRVIALGNAIKLPGLRRYLSQSLGYEIERIDAFRSLTGPQVVDAPAFKENLLCFGTCYGLALQGLGKSGLRTNLLPKEILKDRLVKQKKPWAIAAAAALMLACGISFASFSLALGTVDPGKWKAAEDHASAVANEAKGYVGEQEEAKKQFTDVDAVGKHLIGNVEGRIVWLELLSALNSCLPRDPVADKAKAAAADKVETEEDLIRQITRRNELHVTNIEVQEFDDLAVWFAQYQRYYQRLPGEAAAAKPAEAAAPAEAAPPAEPPAEGEAPAAAAVAGGPAGKGWVIAVKGYHYHNATPPNIGAAYVNRTLINSLQTGTVLLPTGEGDKREKVSMKELGLSYPMLVTTERAKEVEIQNPNATAEAETARADFGVRGEGGRPSPRAVANDTPLGPATIHLSRFDFVVHVCWKRTPPSEREKLKREKEKEKPNAEGAAPADAAPPAAAPPVT